MDIDQSHLLASPIKTETNMSEVEETKDEQPKASHFIEVDSVMVRNVWPYLRPTKVCPSDERLKKSIDLCRDLHEELLEKMKLNDAKIDKLLKTTPSCTSDNVGAFNLRDQTVNSLQILEDIPCDYTDWVDTEAENEWVSRTLKLFYFSQKKFTMINKWARWPDIFHTSDDKYFEKASKAIEDDVEELDQYLQDKCKEMDLQSMTAENMARIECLVELIGGIKMCDPHCDSVDSSIC
jgi:transcription termination factor NusB